MRKYLVFLFIPILFIWANSNITAHKNQSALMDSTLKIEPIEGVEDVTLSKTHVYTECPWSNSCPKEEAKIKVTTIAKNTRKDKFDYYYIITGGKIIGTGADVIWELSEAKPGKYTITVGIGNDKVIRGNTLTKSIELEECPMCDAPSPPCYCPTISISAPSKPVKSGDSIIFTADVEGGSQVSISYEWRVSDGQIAGSKTAAQVLVDTSSVKGNDITATLRIGGTDPGCDCPIEMSKTVSITHEKP